MASYLPSARYVDAWSAEVSREPHARTLLEQPIVLSHRGGGHVVALRDQCLHRFAPLSKGKDEGDRGVCGYHGLSFDANGNCVDECLAQQLCESANLRSYSVVDRNTTIWIWMGDPSLADPSQVPDLSTTNDTENFHIIHEYTYVKANGEVCVGGISIT